MLQGAWRCIYLLEFSFSSDKYSELLDRMVVVFFFFLDPLMFFIVAASIYIPTNSMEGFPFLHIFANTSRLFDNSQFNRCEVISHCGFDFHFLDD